jgi:hypothetical protein
MPHALQRRFPRPKYSFIAARYPAQNEISNEELIWLIGQIRKIAGIDQEPSCEAKLKKSRLHNSKLLA